jgi:two-component system OmpR family response regulator
MQQGCGVERIAARPGEKVGAVRILITEDDPALAEALRFSLTQHGYAVDWVQTGALADRALRDEVFDLLILDLGLPELDGFDVLRRLRKRDSRIRVLILSARETAQEKVQGLDLGADDFLAKPFSLDELQPRVRALLRRRHDTSATVIRAADLAFDTTERIASVGDRSLELSMHETAVLEALLTRMGKVVSKDQLVEQLYNYERDVGYNAIEVYIHRLRKKLDGSGLTVRTMYGRGYALEVGSAIKE